ncbi:YbaB/EbfC family nucleoid-associated protein [Actinokineospora enzanensis]|uniref:YbaB/EbfC family nucleoid-associated protein n=1 Tax=Actinokineospora enzanensis TaxID=155975 RepID=UPI00036A056B|nr:YbaB/EbfC family nucleoid-associated protein [Actinokineospora enzanensis]
MPQGDALHGAVQRFEEQAARLAGLRESIGGLSGSARNTDGSVTVSVAPSGAVLGLTLTPAAMGMSHTQLGHEILSTIRRATEQAAAAMAEVVRPVVGEDQYDRFQEAFRAHAGQAAFGPTTPPPASALAVPVAGPRADFRAPRPDPEPDDDFGGSIYGGAR